MTEEKNVDERPVVLKVDHVAKMFRLPTEQATGLKMAFLNWTKGIKGYTEQHVLRDINFEVRQGDFFGIVGRNGSGKSTLLKIISQIYTPEQGSVTVKGKLVPFIELGVGFNPELTGRENVYLNGALLGFTRTQIDAMYDDIVEFAELEDFMDQKLKNYSSGMQVRLAFSVAIKAQGDILVLDEVLAVGDEAFQRKCDNFFAEIKKDPSAGTRKRKKTRKRKANIHLASASAFPHSAFCRFPNRCSLARIHSNSTSNMICATARTSSSTSPCRYWTSSAAAFRMIVASHSRSTRQAITRCISLCLCISSMTVTSKSSPLCALFLIPAI